MRLLDFASIPCESYSQANRFRCSEEGNKIAYRTLQILHRIPPDLVRLILGAAEAEPT